MMQTLLFAISLQTLLFSTSPLPLNLSLASQQEAHICTSYCTHARRASTGIAFGAHMGKVIKEKQLYGNDYKIKTIVLDPGHGGKDPGCSGKYSQEKHIALYIAKGLSEKLKTAFPDLNVILTRTDDTFIPLNERASIANSNNADLFISIHCNAIERYYGTAGSETYVLGLHRAEDNLNVAKRENAAILLEEDYEKNYDGFDPDSDEGHIILSMFQNAYLEQSILLGSLIENRIQADAARKSRGVKQAGFLVLRETTMPSVLVEAGFLTNRAEENFLRSKAGQEKMATAIFNAFEDYKHALEGTTRTPPPATIEAAPIVQVASSPTPPPAQNQPTIQPTPQVQATPRSQPSTRPQAVYVSNVSTTGEISAASIKADLTAKETVLDPYDSDDAAISKVIDDIDLQFGSNKSGSTANTKTNLPIQYRVQLAASDKKLNTNTSKWQDMPYIVEIIWENNLHKYQIRNIPTFQQAEKIRIEMMRRGFTQAFITAYQGSKRIPVTAARKQKAPVGM